MFSLFLYAKPKGIPELSGWTSQSSYVSQRARGHSQVTFDLGHDTN